MKEKHPAIFLDRDGVINHHIYYEDTDEWESPRVPEDLKLIAGSLEAMHALSASYLLFIISNQPSYAKGKTSLENLKGIHEKLLALLKEKEIPLQEAFYCFHHPQGLGGSCLCRKPSPYFLNLAIERFCLDRERSYFIGDRKTDSQCAKKAGVRFMGIQSDDPRNKHPLDTDQMVYCSLLDAIGGVIR